MSGGSWNYLYAKVQDAADQLDGSPTMIRRAFGKHLRLIAEALHDIEWVDSCDYGRGDEEKAIRAALGEGVTAATLSEAADQLRQAIAIGKLELDLITAEAEKR